LPRGASWCWLGLLTWLFLTPSHGAACPSGEYEVFGVVYDDFGRPLPDAEVLVLLDRVSEKKTRKQGIRARSTRTDASGHYLRGITCGGEPNPCASAPRYLSVGVATERHSLRVRVFRLKDLEIVEEDGRCQVEAPAIRLSAQP
jgi:hypothetical protein